MKNYYEILGIHFDASPEEIKKAFREMAMKYHPDKHQDKENTEYYEEMFKQINEAYEVLRDEEKRRQYNIDYILYEEEQKRKAQARKEREQRRKQTNNRRTSRVENNNENTRSREKKESFFADIKTSFKEVKEDEKKDPLFKRHSRYNQALWNRCGQFTDTIPGNIFFRLSQGVVHISAELLHQLSKVKYVSKDNVIKFTIRNRVTAAAIAGIIIASNIPAFISGDNKTNTNTNTNINTSDDKVVPGRDTEAETTDDDYDDNYDTTTTLTRMYVVQPGDSLSSLSDMSLSSVNTIKSINDIKNDIIRYGETIKLPYAVEDEDLQYYIEQVDTEGLSVKDLAEKYETDEDTLVRLNEEEIGTVNHSKVFIKDKVFVPKFITQEELEEQKSATTHKKR